MLDAFARGALRALRPRRLLLTHFGPHTWCDELLAQMQQRLPAAVKLVRLALDAGLDEEAIVERLLATSARAAAADGPDAAGRMEIVMPSRLNALGLIRYVKTAALR